MPVEVANFVSRRVDAQEQNSSASGEIQCPLDSLTKITYAVVDSLGIGVSTWAQGFAAIETGNLGVTKSAIKVFWLALGQMLPILKTAIPENSFVPAFAPLASSISNVRAFKQFGLMLSGLACLSNNFGSTNSFVCLGNSIASVVFSCAMPIIVLFNMFVLGVQYSSRALVGAGIVGLGLAHIGVTKLSESSDEGPGECSGSLSAAWTVTALAGMVGNPLLQARYQCDNGNCLLGDEFAFGAGAYFSAFAFLVLLGQTMLGSFGGDSEFARSWGCTTDVLTSQFSFDLKKYGLLVLLAITQGMFGSFDASLVCKQGSATAAILKVAAGFIPWMIQVTGFGEDFVLSDLARNAVMLLGAIIHVT